MYNCTDQMYQTKRDISNLKKFSIDRVVSRFLLLKLCCRLVICIYDDHQVVEKNRMFRLFGGKNEARLRHELVLCMYRAFYVWPRR